MTHSLKTRLLLVPALFLSLPMALAQVPSGQVAFYFGRSTYPVWDFSGPYTLSQKIVTAGGSTMNMTFPIGLTQDLSGALHGKGTTMVAIGSEVVAANYTVNGAVSLGGNATRVIFTVSLSGDGLDAIGGVARRFTASLSYNLRVDPNIANAPAWIAPVTGVPIRGSINVAGLGGSTIVSGVDNTALSIPLPRNVDGSWVCRMNLISIGQRIAGTGSITVNAYATPENPVGGTTTRVMSANVNAKYIATQNQTQAVLTPMAGSAPMSLQAFFVAGANAPARLSGKVLGQTVQE